MPDHRPHASAAFAVHGAARLAPVEVDAYEAEIHGAGGGLVGDRASRRAFHLILEEWRERLRRAAGEDPLGETPSDGLGKKKLRRLLAEGEPEAAGVLHGAIEDFAQELAAVARRFLGLEGWRGTQRIVVGGGLRGGRVGEVAIGRAAVLLKVEGQGVEMRAIRHHPDEAGLIGCVHLAPPWVFAGHDGILAADIGGTNIRAGVVEPNLGEAPDLAEARVWASERWRQADDGLTRDGAVERLGGMLRRLVRRAEKEGLRLAPFLGVGCPGRVAEDESIERGGQNLPGGGWEDGRFNLPRRLREILPAVGGHETVVAMHNDAVVQGLSEAPFARDVERWGVLTIGTGLGNARFTNRAAPGERG